MRTLILWKEISRRLGTCGLTHEGLPVFLNGLRSDLENHYHEFDFVIDDSTSPDHLFIEDFDHDSRPV